MPSKKQTIYFVVVDDGLPVAYSICPRDAAKKAKALGGRVVKQSG